MEDEEIIGFDALWDSAMKCKKGVMWKDSAASYIHNITERTAQLSQQLVDGTYRERPPRYFTIYEPKRRDIMSITFRDRVYQRSLNDNAIYPAMTKSFIRDNCACQKGRGTNDARHRLKYFMQQYYRKHGVDGWVLQIDIKGYYPNMRHDVAKETFKRKLPDNIYCRAEAILDSFPGDVGFNPGSQIIQIAGIAVLDSLDHFCKEVLRCKWYERYMDDIVILSDDRAELEQWLLAIQEKLALIRFTTHEKKTRIYSMKDGVRFLGFIFRTTPTGKVLMLMPGDKVRHERRKLRRMVNLAKLGEVTREKCDQCYESWRAHAKLGNTAKMLMKMDRYYNGLWRDEHAKEDIG